jgi:hypothetical protein
MNQGDGASRRTTQRRGRHDVANDRIERASATERSRRADPQAEDAVDARLGRPPRDVIEATIVLEAWAGRSARSAMSAARHLVSADAPARPVKGRFDPPEDRERQSVVWEGIALVLSILSIAAWAAPLSRELGPHVLETSIQVALPVAVALQWGLRSRYLSRPHGLALLAHEGILSSALLIVLIEVPLVLLQRWGPVAAMLVAVWVAGSVLTRRGWAVIYALALVATTVALDGDQAAYVVLGVLTAFTLLASALAVLTKRRQTDDRAGTLPRALLAASLGCAVGVLLVADPSLGWGVHGVHPAIALVPSVIGSFWGGYYLWRLYAAIPRGLSGVPLDRASQIGMNDPAMRVFLGAILRLVGTTVVLSAVVVALGHWTSGTDDISVFLAFGLAALFSMMLSLLESLSLYGAAVMAVVGALAAEIAWRTTVPGHFAGGALAVGGAVGVLLTLPPLVALLSRSGRVLATALWIR